MKAMFPGSFNPIHKGHIEIIKEAAKIYEKLFVFVANNEEKKYSRTLDFRQKLINKVINNEGLKNVDVIKQTPGTLTPLVAKELGIETIVRGLKTKVLSEYEDKLANSYLELNQNLCFHYIVLEDLNISSTLINEEIKKGNSISNLVPEIIENDIIFEKLENIKKGKIVILCGPSGSGKGTIQNFFLNKKEFNFKPSISATTREKRENEKDGVNYLFLTKEEFKKWISEDKFCEHAIFSGNYYGTPTHKLNEILEKGKNAFLEIELQGVKQIIKKFPNAVTIFLSPPSITELEKRLRKRDTESENIIRKRIEIAKEEIKFANNKSLFKYNVINKDIEKASDEIIKILRRELNV